MSVGAVPGARSSFASVDDEVHGVCAAGKTNQVWQCWARQEEAPQSKRRRSAGGSAAPAPQGAEVLVEEHEAPISGAELLDTQVRFFH